jgi:hypothetical protein
MLRLTFVSLSARRYTGGGMFFKSQRYFSRIEVSTLAMSAATETASHNCAKSKHEIRN